MDLETAYTSMLIFTKFSDLIGTWLFPKVNEWRVQLLKHA